jgi:GntR family transcriptional regulator
MLDRRSPIPLYHQLSQSLLAQITNGEFEPGDALPPERELTQAFDVSRITVRRAIDELENEGYVRRVQGKGTFVAPPRIQRGILKLTSFSEDIAALGMRPGSKLLTLRQEPAQTRVARELRLSEGATVWFVERLRFADADVVGLNLSYLALPDSVTLSRDELEKEVSLWKVLADKGIVLKESDKVIGAIAAEDWHAELLEVRERTPLLQVEGVAYSEAGEPIEFHQIITRADRYKYHLHVTR